MSVWLLLSDGGLVAAYLPLPELLERGHTVVEGRAGCAQGRRAGIALTLRRAVALVAAAYAALLVLALLVRPG